MLTRLCGRIKTMENYNLKQYAHIGDAVWELFVREECIKKTGDLKKLHNFTVSFVNAIFQADLMSFLDNHLTEEEKELARRGRNLKMTVNKKSNPKIHSLATSFEVLIGYFYLENKTRLEEIFEIIKKSLNDLKNN